MKHTPFLHGLLILAIGSLQLLLPAVSGAQEKENWRVPLTAGKDGWMTYQNARFGYIIPVPPGMKPLRPADNGGGQVFATADGKVKLAVYGGFNVDGSADISESWKLALKEPGRIITYQRRKDGWCVVSGVTKDGVGFYERYDANAKYCAGWSLVHPQTEEAKYSKWIDRIAKGYQTRFGKGEDRIE